ncbi:hypothetical protein D3C86_1710730 [compost metagenome]
MISALTACFGKSGCQYDGMPDACLCHVLQCAGDVLNRNENERQIDGLTDARASAVGLLAQELRTPRIDTVDAPTEFPRLQVCIELSSPSRSLAGADNGDGLGGEEIRR